MEIWEQLECEHATVLLPTHPAILTTLDKTKTHCTLSAACSWTPSLSNIYSRAIVPNIYSEMHSHCSTTYLK